jgi:hypothetical protein
MAALQVSLQAAVLDVSGEQAGGQLQLQGLNTAEPIAASLRSTALEAAASRPGLQESPNAPLPLPEAPTGPSRTFISGSTLNAGSRRGQGGEVTLLGDEIELRGNTIVTATGETGGGHIFVGGGWQGAGDLPQATRALVDSTVTLDASAFTQGDGGTIVVWSDVTKASAVTTVNGKLTARGGAQSGNGGRIETSGYDLQVDGIQVSTAAPKGQTGEWLLDPYDITISSGTGSGTTGTYTANADSAVINISALQTALNTSNVRVYTGDSGSQTGNITVAAALTNSTSNSLTLHAAGSIVINADLTSSGTGVLSLLAGSGSVSGTGSLILGSAGNLTGATLQIAHGATVSNNIVLNGATTVKLEGMLVDYLVVGGGGGGGGFYAGGGGGGGVLRGSLNLLGTGYSVTVGAGGAAGMNRAYGTNGGSSSAFGLTALGGGAGGYYDASGKGGSGNGTAGKSGASGGGGGGSDIANGSNSFVGGSGGAATQGNSGGQGASDYNAGGGGGGAGSAGSAGSDSAAGNGGSGLASSITGVSITYGSGGGGGAPVGSSGGAGGPGAGDGAIGTGAGTPNGENGSANTGGGGGGGAWRLGQDMYGGNGGSGTVVVRYASSTSVTSGGTAGSYTSGGVTYRFPRFSNV